MTAKSSAEATAVLTRRWCRKHQSWPLFITKVVCIFGCVFLSGFISGIAFASQYSLVFDSQGVRCIPDYRFYIVDRKDTTLVRDRLYMFYSKDLSPIYPEGTKMLKYLRALPGDAVHISEGDQIFINGRPKEYGLLLAQSHLGQPASAFRGDITLGDDQYWFLATSPQSFDSRYWGAVARERIVGRAYAIF
ncbi:MAG: S26 family signal peptidase [Cellvibrionaceae bacterium]|nr:S26 family signal peptidase [Cellvibrionaceae bacterium]